MVLLLEHDMRESFPKPRLGVKTEVFPSRSHDFPCQIHVSSAFCGTRLLRVRYPGWTIVWQRLLDPHYLLLGRLNDPVKGRSRWPIRVVRSL
jgi:hypothetical protein